MATVKEQILALVGTTSGLTDREITNRLRGADAPQQPINQIANALAASGQIVRRPRHDGKLGNYPSGSVIPQIEQLTPQANPTFLTEDDVKRNLKRWLEDSGWHVDVMWAKERGIDIVATRDGVRWVIEA